MSFAQLNLDSNILKAIQLCGYSEATPIQAQSIPSILEGRDVVACAQTGTGKTAAFVLPAMHHLSLKGAAKQTRILILTPTRELASQITNATRDYGKFLRFSIVNLVGGMPYPQQIRELARGADIIVATPGRLLDHIQQNRVNLSGIEMLVLDEADRMLDMGFIDDVTYISKLTPSDRQTLLFSATMDSQLSGIIKQLLKNPIRIDLSKEKMSAPNIRQEIYKTRNMHHKVQLLKQILAEQSIFKAIIFSATKMNADKLADDLCDSGLSAAALHGDLRQNVRNRTIEKLRKGTVQYLVATDVAARGIDISDVTHVINFDLPKFSEDYVHRIGRTGRAGKSGVAISFVSSTDAKHLQSIERYLGQRLPLAQHIDILEPVRKPKRFEARESNDNRESAITYSDKITKKPVRKFAGKSLQSRDTSFADERPARSGRKPGKAAWQADRPEGKAPRTDRFDDDKRRSKADKPAWRSDNTKSGNAPRSKRFGEDSRRSIGGKPDWKSERTEGKTPSRNRFDDKPRSKTGKTDWKADRTEGKAPSRNRFDDKPRSKTGKPDWKSERTDGKAPRSQGFSSDKPRSKRAEGKSPRGERFDEDSRRKTDGTSKHSSREEGFSRPRSSKPSGAKKSWSNERSSDFPKRKFAKSSSAKNSSAKKSSRQKQRETA